jgi:hypothetical protein
MCVMWERAKRKMKEVRRGRSDAASMMVWAA